MSSREHTIDAKIKADTTDFSKGMAAVDKDLDKAGQGFSKYGSEADKASKQTKSFVETNRGHMETLGKDAMLMGAGMLAGLGLAAKAAISWESAWAGVRKTTDGSPEEMAALEKELRGLAKTLPATHEEIAGVAEAAGQLGIQRQNVAAFTKTMIDLGESTNLSAEEAATGLARLSNIMGTSQGDVSRLGSTLVGLGNNFATTEGEILAMTMRLAGAGKQAGLTEGDVMGIATAMSSVGIEAEAGGTAMSLTMKRIEKATLEGGDSLDLFASTSGMTSSEFQKAWKDDAAGALTTFITGLGKTAEAGGSTNAVLTELGITGIREADSLLRLSSASGVLTDALSVGNEAFRENTALAEEASKRYETTESKVKIAWNGIKDSAIDAGAVLLPIIQGVAESAAGLASAFSSLPVPARNGLVAVTGIAGGVLLFGGALLTAIPRVYDSVKAIQALHAAAPKTAGVLGDLGKAAAIAAAAIAALKIAASIVDSMRPAAKSVDETTQAIIRMIKAGDTAALDDIFGSFQGGTLIAKDINGVADAINRMNQMDFNETVNKWFNDVSGGTLSDSLKTVREQVSNVDTALSNMASGGQFELAANGFKTIADSADVSLETVAASFPQYIDSLRRVASETGVAVSETELLEWALGKVPPAMLDAQTATEGQARAAEVAAQQSADLEKALGDIGVSASGAVTDLVKFTGALVDAGLLNLSARDASRQYQAALEAQREALKTNGTIMDRTTEKGRANEAALDAIADAGIRSTVAMAKNNEGQEALQGNLQQTYQDLLNAARGLTATEEEAVALTREILKVPDGVSIDSWMNDAAKIMAGEIATAVNNIPSRKDISIVTTYSEISAGGGAADAARRMQIEGKAGGGPLHGPGPKGVDSKLFWGAPGEHVWTAREVDAAGGHEAMHAMRQAVLHPSMQHAIQHSTSAPAVAGSSAGQPVYVTVYSTNPLTGEQIVQTMETVARSEVESGFRAANDDFARGRAR